MIELLSKKDQRIVRILDYLVDARKTSYQALSKGTGVAERTLWGDVRRINDICKPAAVQSTKDGVALLIPSEYNERYLFDQIMRDSVELNVLEEIFLQRSFSIADLAQRFFLSEVTMRRMLAQINKTLNRFEISITSNPLEIIGEPAKVIQLFEVYFLEKYNRVNRFMKPREIKAVEVLFNSIVQTQQLIQSNQDYNLLVLRFYVRLRYLIGTPQNTLDEDLSYVQNYEQVNREFKAAFGIKLTPAIIHFCIPYLFEDQALSNRKLYQDVVTFLERFIEDAGMNFTSYDEMVNTLYHILEECQEISCIVYDRDRHFVTHLELYNPLLVNKVRTLFLEMFPNHQSVLYKVLYVFFTHWEGLITMFKNRDREIDVAIFFDSDLEHAQFAKEVLEHEFGELIHFNVLDLKTYEELYNHLYRYDILVTNTPGIQYDQCEIICLDEFFLEDSWSELRMKLLQMETDILTHA